MGKHRFRIQFLVETSAGFHKHFRERNVLNDKFIIIVKFPVYLFHQSTYTYNVQVLDIINLKKNFPTTSLQAVTGNISI